MNILILTALIAFSLATCAFAQTFNAVENSKQYKTAITGVPVDFEEEQIDPEEARLYNQGDDQEIIDEYDIPEMVVDTHREENKKEIKKSPMHSNKLAEGSTSAGFKEK